VVTHQQSYVRNVSTHRIEPKYVPRSPKKIVSVAKPVEVIQTPPRREIPQPRKVIVPSKRPPPPYSYRARVERSPLQYPKGVKRGPIPQHPPDKYVPPTKYKKPEIIEVKKVSILPYNL
jgi:hypothetical protein